MSIAHKVKQGETIATIGLQYGFKNWETVWQNEDNQDNHPWPNALKPGTVVKVPEPELGEGTASVGGTTTFTIKKPKQLFRAMPQDSMGNHFGGKPYKLKIDALSVPYEGTIPDNGIIEHDLPFSAKQATLLVSPYDQYPDLEEVWQIEIGGLNPVEDISGIQQRLTNLGIECGPIDSVNGPRTIAALKYFQTIHELEPTGEPDEATMEALRNPTVPVFPEGEESGPIEGIIKAVEEAENNATELFQFKLVDISGQAFPGQPFRFKHSRGKITRGYTDEEGHGNIREVSSTNGILSFPNLEIIALTEDGTFAEELELPIDDTIPEVVGLEKYPEFSY